MLKEDRKSKLQTEGQTKQCTESGTEVLLLSGNMAFRVQYRVGTGAWREKGNGNQSRIPSHNLGIHLFRMRQAHRK